jgi:acyl-CoA synthetase (AMP-forming)/AMP-acid ligase II
VDAAQLDALSFEPLTPLRFLDRAAAVFAGEVAVVDGDVRRTYAEFGERCRRFAGALRELGVEPGDRVAVLAPNSSLLLEAHYGVPGCGAVLVALNFRLSAGELAAILEHSGARLLLFDRELAAPAAQALAAVGWPPMALSDSEFEAQLASAPALDRPPVDERALISINYTSGTTGTPKGVMYHHRGAYLQALAMALHAGLGARSAFLWTLPMFHCNGWCFTWAVTAAGGRHVCLRRLDPPLVWELIERESVTHLNAAPTVLTMISEGRSAPAERRIHVCTGGAPPSPTLIANLDRLGMHVTHLYGLTETFGPVMLCEPQPGWEGADPAALALLLARQGVGNVIACPPRVLDPSGSDVPADGLTLGEIALRGNDVMLGYYRAPELTAQAAPDGWFRSGDLAVVHPDGYIEIRDRAKDIIISGGENIPSVEVEQALVSHPAVLEAAVVGASDERWGEVPVAYVTLREGAQVQDAELIEHVKGRIARFKAPKRVVYGPLPKTATGKVMKYALRERLRGGE